MALLKSKVHGENMGRATATFQVLLENVGHFGFWTFWFLDILVFGQFGNDSVLRYICWHICLTADYTYQVYLTTPKSMGAENEGDRGDASPAVEKSARDVPQKL